MSAVTAPIAAQSTREALGGAWTTSLTVWLALLVPALALSAYQNFGVPYPSGLVATIACVVPCVAAGLVFLVAGPLRRSVRTIPVVFCLLFWAAVGTTHGLTTALLSIALSHSPPHIPGQTIYWAASCVIWLPLMTYSIAQSAYRRHLLVALSLETRRNAFLRRSSLLEIADLRSLIVVAIQDNIRPVLIEIEHSLKSLGPALDGKRLAELGKQLADVSEETTRIIETTLGEPAIQAPSWTRQPIAPVAAALDFDQTRPVVAAVLSSVALLPLVVAVSFSEATVDIDGIESAVFILAIVAVLLIAGHVAQRLVRQLKRTTRIVSALVAYIVAGITAAVVAVLGPWQPVNHQNLALAVFLPIAVPLAAITLSAAVGLGNANLGVVRQIAEVEADIERVENGIEHDRSDIRDQVAALTHGPLRGRLAACAMALNFHAAEIATTKPARTEYIISSVRDHLSDVLDELDSLR